MDVDLPDSLKARTIGAIAQRCANDEVLARQGEQIAKGRRALRFLVIGMAILTCACLFAIWFAWWRSDSDITRRLASAERDQRAAKDLLNRRLNGLRAVRDHTFFSRFYKSDAGWFIDFPRGTAFKTFNYPVPTVQVFPPQWLTGS